VECLSRFLAGTQAVAFSLSSDKDEHYRWLQKELIRFDYLSLKKPEGQRLLAATIDPPDRPVPQDRPIETPSANRSGFQTLLHRPRYPATR